MSNDPVTFMYSWQKAELFPTAVKNAFEEEWRKAFQNWIVSILLSSLISTTTE